MSQRSGNDVKPPVHDDENGAPTTRDDLHQQHHGDTQKAPQGERSIGHSTGTGRPPLMKK